MEQWSHKQIAAALPPLEADANKYTRGHLYVVAGCSRYPGAACLCAAAAQRAGAGYTSVRCSEEALPIVRTFRPSLVAESWEDLTETALAQRDHAHPIAVALGSGFDAADGMCQKISLWSLTEVNAPLLLDGGALGAIANPYGLSRIALRNQKNCGPLVLTPHGGEAKRLAEAAGITETEAPQLARALANTYHATVALKVPDTYISNGEAVIAMTEGTAALAKAGTGDVLAGIIGSLMAQGCAPLEACVAGTTLHARAATLAADRLGPRSVIPEDLLEYLPEALRSFDCALRAPLRMTTRVEKSSGA